MSIIYPLNLQNLVIEEEYSFRRFGQRFWRDCDVSAVLYLLLLISTAHGERTIFASSPRLVTFTNKNVLVIHL